MACDHVLTSTFKDCFGQVYCPGHAEVKGNNQADKLAEQSNQHKWLASQKIFSVKDLKTLPAGKEPRTSHHKLRGGEIRHTKGSG